jgi:hypothetical protein
MGGSRITVGDVEISDLNDLVAEFRLTLDQASPTVPAEAWKRSAAMATTHRPGPDTQITPAQRPQAPAARRANRVWPHAAVIATAGAAIGAFATAAAMLLAPTAAAKSGEYAQVCGGPHNVTAATCQPGALQQVPLGGATPEGCRRTGPVSTACGRRTDHVDPSGTGGAATTLTSRTQPGGATSTLAVSGGAHSTITGPTGTGSATSTPTLSGGAPSIITSPQSSTRPNSASSHRFSPTHTQAFHTKSHR